MVILDVVLWDSHPLALGATPKQVFIDGIAQLQSPYSKEKPPSSQRPPKTPNFDQEAKDAVKYDGLPPLELKKSKADVVLFTNVSSIYLKRGGKIREVFSVSDSGNIGVVVVENGQLKCFGADAQCSLDQFSANVERVNLEGGSISQATYSPLCLTLLIICSHLRPTLISYGSPLGLEDIQGEPSTHDGSTPNPLTSNSSPLLGEGPVIRAVDGLKFATRDAL